MARFGQAAVFPFLLYLTSVVGMVCNPTRENGLNGTFHFRFFCLLLHYEHHVLFTSLPMASDVLFASQVDNLTVLLHVGRLSVGRI